jgi:hypothetical protein
LSPKVGRWGTWLNAVCARAWIKNPGKPDARFKYEINNDV